MDLQKLNEALSNGILPDELNFTKQNNQDEVDMNKLKYNAFYRSYEFYESKFPPGYECIPGFNKIIELIAEKAEENQVTPLEEILERQNDCNNNNE
jgi:hypothetical protein